MIEFLLGGVVLLSIITVILLIKVVKRKTRIEVEKGLNESQEEHIKIIETGSNFRTRMSDFKDSTDKLKSAMDTRNRMLSDLRGVQDNAGRPGRESEKTGIRKKGA